MIPVLFKKGEQQFRTYGLGEISDIINPKVTRERNGQYILYFQYPQNAKFSDVFEEDMRIKSDAGVRTKWQTFEISRVIRKEGQLIEVFAKHISQSLLKDALNPSVNVPSSNAQQALNIWNSNRIGDEEFNVWSDITTVSSTSWNIREVSNAFEALAGVQGSILDVWGGEYEFDNKMIRLHKEMGRKSPVPLEYGRNITGLEQDQQEDNIYTSIYPFAVFIPEGVEEPETITLPEYYVDGKYLDMYPKRKIQVVDFSGEFGHDDIPTVDRLRALANQYAEINEVGLPHENLKVEYIDLSKTLDYQEFQTMEEVELNDRLPIFYPKFGITNESAKVVVINYDPVNEENISIELGVIGQSFRTVTTGGIGSRLDKIEKQQDATNNYVVNNKGNRIWFETPDEGMEHKIGDTWFEKNGPYDRIRVWNGNQWETIIDSEDIDKNADAIAEQQQEIEDVREVADEAWNELEQAKRNAGFESLDDTLQNMNYITMNAEQNAQQAITNASNAYGLAQTSISEAQTAQANSLTALGKADNALDGVSSLDVRVDDVEAELELKADNTFMNEDGTLTTLSNAITFNAHRFSSDMSRIESRVESLVGEINLVILRDAFEGTQLVGGEAYPKPTKNQYTTFNDTMREMIDVEQGEQLALSKDFIDGIPSNERHWRVNFYLDNTYNSQLTITEDNFILTVPNGVNRMWVSYPRGSKPQIVRGTSFIPYRPNMADQMTTNEMVLFRNEYDEYADRTERRLTAIDSTGGSLDVLSNEIITSAEKVTTDMTALINTKVGDEEFTQFYQNEYLETAGEINRKISLSDIEIGGRNMAWGLGGGLYKASRFYSGDYQQISEETVNGKVWIKSSSSFFRLASISLEPKTTYTWSFDVFAETHKRINFTSYVQGSETIYVYSPYTPERVSTTFTTGDTRTSTILHISDLSPDVRLANFKLEKGNVASDWTQALEDSDAKISHIQTEWTQTFEMFEQTITGPNGINTQLQTLETSLSAISHPATGRLTIAEQNLDGFRNEVYNTDGSSKITQLANGISSLVSSKPKNILLNGDIGSSMDSLILGPGVSNYGRTGIVRHLYSSSTNKASNWIYFLPHIYAGKRYKVTFQAKADANGKTITIGRDGATTNITIPLTTTVQSYEVVFEPDGFDTFRMFLDSVGTYDLGSVVVVETTAVSQAQFSMLENNINLRVTKGDVINQINVSNESILIQSNRILLDGDVTVSGTAWLPGAVIANASIDGAKITDATIGSAKIVDLDVSKISGNKAEFITASFNGINSYTQIDADGIYMSGSGLWRRTYLSATGFDLYNGSGGSNKAGAIGYFKEHYDNTTSTENYFAATKGSKHYIGIGANNTHHIAFGYQDDSSIVRKYTKALQIDGDTGRIRLYSPLSSRGSNYELNLAAYDDSPHGIAWERSNSGIMFANSGTKIWDESGGEWDDYNMSNRRKIGFYGDSGIQALTTNKNMEIWAGGQAIKFYVGTNALRFQVGGGAIQAYTDIGMNGNNITGQSDERLKTNIRAREELIINKLKQFNFVDFDWIESGKSAFGLIAQQVQKFAPELVSMDETNMLTLNNTLLNMYTTKSVVEINQKVDDLTESTDDKIHKLQQELSKANRRIEELEGAV